MNDFVGSPALFGEAPSLPQQIRTNFLEPPEQDPKKSRELKTLQAAGVDPSLNVEQAKARFLADTFSDTNWMQRHPTLAAKLADREYVQIARDDLGNLIETEGLANEVANAWRVSRNTVFAGQIGTRAMLDGRDLYPYERERLKRAEELAAAYMASDPGYIASTVELAGTLVETAGVSALAGGVTGAFFPPAAPYVAGAAAYATSFQLEGGNLYAELLKEFEGDMTPAEARDIAIGYGSIIAGVDLIGLKVATAPIKGLIKEIAKKRGKGLLTREAASRMTLRILGQGAFGAVSEAGTEGVQDVLQERAKRVASELYRPNNLYEPEYEESFWRAFNHTFKGMVLMAGLPTGARVINNNIKAANANYDYQQAKKAAEIRGRSKSPEAQREVEAEAGETDTLNSTYYIRAQDLTNAIAEGVKEGVVTEKQVRDTIEANSPGLMARIDEAAERDGEVELTKTEFEDAFDNTLLRETALSNTAFQEDGMTKREYDEVDRLRDKMVKEQGEEAAKDLQDMEKFESELREVRQEVRRDLEKVLKGTDAELTMNAAANASLLIGFIRRAALQRNVSPREFVEKHLPQIVQKRLEGQQAQQQTEQQAKPKKERPRRAPKPTDPTGEGIHGAINQFLVSVSEIKDELKRAMIFRLMDQLGRDNDAEADAQRQRQINRLVNESHPSAVFDDDGNLVSSVAMELPMADMMHAVAKIRRAKVAAGEEISDGFDADLLERQMDDILDPLPMEEEQTEQTEQQTEQQAAPAPVVEVVEAAPEMAEAMAEAQEAPVTRVTPVVASAATENPQRQAADPEPAAEPEVEVAPEVEPEVTEEAAPAPEPAVEPETDEAQLFEGDATPEQIAKFESLLPPRNAQGLFDLSNEKRNEKTGRYDNMGAALRAMERGEITRQQRDAIVDIYKPVLPDTRIYPVATPQRMKLALNKDQKPLVNAPVEEGRRVGLRLDIRSVTHPKHPARVIAIHGYQGKKGGKHIRYTNVARVTNAEMSMVVTRAADVAAARKNKDKLGVIYGDYVSTTVAEATKIASDALTDPAWRQVGIDPERHGYYYDRKTGEPLVSADEVVQVGSQVFAKNAKVAGKEQFLYSKEGDQERVLGKAEVMGGDTITKILLDPNAKPTTLMHELMHWNLEIMAEIGLDIEAKLAQEGYEATALEKQMLSDIKELLKWSGFEGTLTEWRAMTIDQRREFHEVIAMSFERYLYEGVAPSRELRGVFSRLLAYISGKFEALVKDFQATYNKIRKDEGKPEQPLPGLNPEVRAIFGRMMSAERDVQAFFDERELEAMMMTKDEWIKSGRDAQEYDEYEEEFKNSIYEAKAEMTQQRMKEAKTFANAYALVAQKQRGELQRITKQIREEVEAQTKMESVYQFLDWMRKKPYQTENGPYTDSRDFTTRKLNGDIVKAKAPALYEELKRRNLISKGGMTLESVRDMFGFESTEAMLEALATHRNFKEEVLHRTNQRLLNEHTDLMDPIVQQENVHAAVHNKIRQKVMARELKFLLQNGRRSKVELELAKRVAIALIEKTPTGRIDVAAYSRAAARARKKAIKALKDGDIEAARLAKRQELVNEQMVVEGLKARKEVRSLVESNKRAFKHRSDSALAKAGYDVTVMKALRAVLSRLGIGNVDFDPNEALARFAQEDPEFAAEVGDNIMALLRKDIAQPRVGDRRKPMEHLTLGDIRALRLLSARMMLRAKNKLTTKIGEKRRKKEQDQEEAVDALESNVKDGGKDLDGKKSIFGKIRNYLSDLIRFEHLFRRADGDKVGIWTRMFRMVKDAGNRYREEVKEFTQNFGDRLRALDLTLPGGNRELEMTVLGETIIIGQNGRNVKSQLIHLAMHYYGNASNRERLLRGYIREDIDPDQLSDAMERADREVKAFLQEQVRQGVLTRKDFEFMQETFKQLSGSDMLGRAQDVMMRLRHYEMNTVEAEEFPIEFPDGETVKFTGGYIPVRYDTSQASVRESDAQGLQDEDMGIDQQAKRMLSILPSFAKDRTTSAGLPLELNLANIQHHAAEVFRFIHMAEPVTEVYKVVSGRKVQQAFIRKFGAKAYRNMEGWLKRSAYQKMDRDEDTQVGNMMLTMSRNANKGVMFLNIGNALQNYAGLVIPMRRVGARRIISALISNMFSKGPRIEAIEKSTELRLRTERQIFDIYNQQNQLLTQESGVWDKISNWSNRYAYFLQQWTQNHVDVAVWQAAYNQETERALREFMGDPEGAAKAEARAVAYADSIVRQTQMAGEIEDLSHFESQGSIYRAMFPFKSWFINWMNNAENQRRLDLNKEGQAKAAALASSYMYLLMLPAMLALAATELARGEDFDDDDDGYGDDMFELWWRSQAEQITGGLPLISETTRMIDSVWTDDGFWNNRYPATPWQRVLENLTKAPTKKDAVDATVSVASQLADIMGVPATRVWNSVNLLGDEIAGELESESTYDFVRGAVTGKRSDLQRLSR